MSKLETSRRSFLKWAGAASATVASAGASTASAAIASSAAGTAQVSAKVANVMIALGESGGFPQGAVQSLAFMARWSGNSGENILNIAPRLYGTEGFLKTETFYDSMEKMSMGQRINFYAETELLNCLKSFPPDVPVMDLLSEDIYERVSKNYKSMHSESFLCEFADIQRTRELLAPLCKADTTTGDLMKDFEAYFIRLGEYACQNPQDFFVSLNSHCRGIPKTPDDISARSALRQVSITLENFGHERPEIKSLITKLNDAAQEHERITAITDLKYVQQMMRDADELNRLQREANRAKHLKDLFKRQESLSLRYTLHVRLAQIEPGRFIVSCNEGVPLTRMDWLHWIQTLDPANARVSDIETDYMSRAITVKNKVALTYLNAPERARYEGQINLQIPNRRMGVDLNNTQQPHPQHPSPAQD